MGGVYSDTLGVYILSWIWRSVLYINIPTWAAELLILVERQCESRRPG
ncbi:MAG: hypothetical protein IJY31_01025 [Muribaculaceae bacterium]|nr:hypothetical protein [Muribaculaceae bacterium]